MIRRQLPLGGAAVWPLAARAQQPAMKRVGFLTGLDDSEARERFAAFSQALAALGWIADRNVEIVARFGTADPGRNRAHVTEIIALAPDVIVASNPITIAASIRAAPTIPTVFTLQPDPIAEGFVASLARPGGNITGHRRFCATAQRRADLATERWDRRKTRGDHRSGC
jgi:putative ABC transport system substrate-binding protein